MLLLSLRQRRVSKTAEMAIKTPAARPGTPHGGREMEERAGRETKEEAGWVGVGLGVGVDVGT